MAFVAHDPTQTRGSGVAIMPCGIAPEHRVEIGDGRCQRAFGKLRCRSSNQDRTVKRGKTQCGIEQVGRGYACFHRNPCMAVRDQCIGRREGRGLGKGFERRRELIHSAVA
jgi:hypothetical protein